MLFCLVAYALSFVLFLLLVCLVPGDEHPEQQVRRVNPGRSTSKRYRSSETAGGSSSAPPPPGGASSSANPPRKKKIANRPKPSGKKVTEMSSKEFWDRRRRNPYEEDQESNLVNRPFWNRFQYATYFDVIKAKKNLFVNVHSINMDAMEKDPDYFGDALQMCSQLNILRIMQFNKDFDADLLAQFFATVHLGTDADRTLTWMTNGKVLAVKWQAFMGLLEVEDQGLETPVGFRPHQNVTSTHKQALWPYCTRKVHPETRKETYELSTYLDILHRIFRETLFPRIGNLDMVHSYLVDMLLFCQHEKEANTGESLDISHVMWPDLWSVHHAAY